MGITNLGHQADPVLTRLVDEDTVPWYKKKNLRLLYLLLYPTCMGIEITSGYDSQLINGAQFIPSWNKCKPSRSQIDNKELQLTSYYIVDFGSLIIDGAGKPTYQVTGPLLGMMSCAYNLGAIMAVPIVPYVSNKLGRRWTIALGSLTMIIGAFMQGFSQNGKFRTI